MYGMMNFMLIKKVNKFTYQFIPLFVIIITITFGSPKGARHFYQTITNQEYTLTNVFYNEIISQWNEDPIMKSLKDSRANIEKISFYGNLVDHNFITTDPSVFLKQNKNINNLHFMFIPVDKNIECFDVFNLNPRKDLFYAMSHGVNRATLKKGKNDSRIYFLNSLIKKIKGI